MRDAFGSTFMFRLIIIFIVFYVCFATIAVSYAKVFRIKNRVVDIVEQSQFDHKNNESIAKVKDKIDRYLESSTYSYRDRVANICSDSSSGSSAVDSAILTNNGACIIPKPYGKKGRYYYRVTVYMVVHIPGINYDAVIPISGDTSDYFTNDYTTVKVG